MGNVAPAPGRARFRAAVQEANALSGADTITVPAGVYQLQIPAINTDGPEAGDIDIMSPITITGAGAGTTILDGGPPPLGMPEQRGLDRLLEVHPRSGTVTLQGIALREGFSAEEGGALRNSNTGLLRLIGVHVLDSFASKAGGGIENTAPAGSRSSTPPFRATPPAAGERRSTTPVLGPCHRRQ